MKRTLVVAFACLGLCLSVTSLAAGDPQQGKEKSAECTACHGADGNGENPAFPKIAGQHADYLVHALKAYTTGERKNAIMQGFAAKLSKQDREDLAAWFASQEGLRSAVGQR